MAFQCQWLFGCIDLSCLFHEVNLFAGSSGEWLLAGMFDPVVK